MGISTQLKYYEFKYIDYLGSVSVDNFYLSNSHFHFQLLPKNLLFFRVKQTQLDRNTKNPNTFFLLIYNLIARPPVFMYLFFLSHFYLYLYLHLNSGIVNLYKNHSGKYYKDMSSMLFVFSSSSIIFKGFSHITHPYYNLCLGCIFSIISK